MKKIILLSLLSLCPFTFAEDLLFRPVGTFVYKKNVQITKKRLAETVNHTTSVGAERIKVLKKDGYICPRKNQQFSICQKIITNIETPDFIQVAVDDYLAKASFTFSGIGEAILIHNGSSTEWIVYEPVFLGKKEINVYQIVRTNKDEWFLSFPVSEDQGIGNMNLESNTKLGLPLVLEKNEGPQTAGYFINAMFELDK